MCLAVIGMSVASCNTSDHSQRIEDHRRLAGELQSNRLYRAAIEEYQNILTYDDVDTPTRANINYLVGRVYFDHLGDYENAAAYYVRAKELDPEGSFADQATRKLVA